MDALNASARFCFATEQHDVTPATGPDSSSLGGNLVAFLLLCSAHATEQAYKSGGALATAQSLLQSSATWPLLQDQATVVSAAILLLFLFCVVAMLQSRPTRAAGHWLQHKERTTEPRNSRLLSRTSTSAAELFYLRHTRSCAATATGNKGGHLHQSAALKTSGADYIARQLQSICRNCCITVFNPLARLLQSIWQIGEYFIQTAIRLMMLFQTIWRNCCIAVFAPLARLLQTAIKLMILFLAMLQSYLEIALTWLTPLEVAACFHLVNACIHQNVHTVQEMSAVAVALATLLLALMNWHVPRITKWQPLICRVLTAMCMYALRKDTACTGAALLLPTFGKRSQPKGSTARERSTTANHATELTEAAAMPPITQQGDDQGHAATEHVLPHLSTNTPSTQEQMNSLDDVISIIGPLAGEGERYRALQHDAENLRNAKQDEIRKLCKPWGVMLTHKNQQGKYPRRLDADLKRDIEVKMIERARELQKQLETATPSIATEHLGADFPFEDAVLELLQRFKDGSKAADIMARIVDHACRSPNSISHRVAAMCREAHWHTSTDLCNDQPIDACGYIAADAVCRLREAALREGGGWHHILLPDYAQLHCIHRGNEVLRRTDDDRTLDSDQVNSLVRHYSHLHERRGAAEEWWGGAVGLDHFLIGLSTFAEELSTTTSDKQHQWRAWVVNTQTSAQPGSHWFVVVVAAKTQLPQSAAEHPTGASSSHSLDTVGQLLESIGPNEQQPTHTQLLQSNGIPADPNANNYPNLFHSPDSALSKALLWAQANAREPKVASWLHACRQWDSAVATNEHCSRNKRRMLCKDHDIPFTRDLKSSTDMEYIRRQLSNRIEQLLLQSEASTKKRAAPPDATLHPPRKKVNLSNYFKPMAPGASLPVVEDRDIPDVATDVRSTYLRFHVNRNNHAENKDFHILKNILSELRGYVGQRRLLQLLKDPPKTPKTVRQHFLHLELFWPSFPRSCAEAQKLRRHIRPSQTWSLYYARLCVLTQARRWLSATERLDAIEDAPLTPKTTYQLAVAIKHPTTRDYAPFGRDFEDLDAYSPIITRLLIYAEIHNYEDHTYGTFRAPREELPYTYRQLQDYILERRRLQHLSTTVADSSRQLVQTAADLAVKLCKFASTSIALRYLIMFALPPKKRADAVEVAPSTMDNRSASRGDATEHVTLSPGTAKAMANSFFKFVEQEHLQQHLSPMSAGQILVLCIFHSRLSWQKGKPLVLHDRDQYWIPKPTYTPASQVQAPSPPHFVERIRSTATEHVPAEHVPPEMQPPRTCCLCGKGFVDAPALWKHCDMEHHSWAEAVKRILWEAEQLEAIPLLPPDKRRIIQNFTNALTFSKPAEGHFGRDKACMRQLVGCATCAKVSWIDRCFPCHLFQDCPDALRQREENDADDAETGAATDESSDEEAPATEQRRGRLLKDEDGYYVMDAHAINELLDVSKYIEAWPQIPKEELHASSVQHPSHPEYRWLLNTRRVPVQAPSSGSAATERALPKCAGVGIKDRPLWLCKSCTWALCRPEPLMPFFALANWNWGGRLHPLYYNLSIATKALLGLAIMICRLIVLRHSEHPEDQEKGFVGNTILLTQPRPEEIMQTLPPADAEVSKYLSVCFNNQSMTTADLGKHKALEIDPEEYFRCSEFRKKVCPVFAEVKLDEQQLRTQWPERAVPTAILRGAQAMDTLETFKPTLDGPATMRAPTCNLPSNDKDSRQVIDDNDDDGPDATEHGTGDATEHDAGDATEHANASTLPLDLPAEFLIGMPEDDTHDPVNLMIVFQKNLELVQEAGKRIYTLEQRRVQATGSKELGEAADAAAILAAEKTKHSAALVDLRRLANKMGREYQQQMTDALATARMDGAQANTPRTLHIRSGKPVNIFEAQAWSAAFVEFFYGDCAPNLDRPRRVGVRELFHYLASREELEYSLEADKDDPLIPGGCYRAPPQSRWNSPEFMAVFADVVRKLRILQTTKHMWKDSAPKWRIDIQAICDAKVEHFEQLSAILARHGQQSMPEMMRAAAEHNLLPLFKALQYVSFQTANIPLTQGYKMSLRQLGFALNVYDGPLTVFLTTNFADMYSPISVILMNGAGEPLGKRDFNLLDNEPCMPTLQAMHRASAKHPMLQVEAFLLLDDLVHADLCCMSAFIGVRAYGDTAKQPFREDDFATDGQHGIAQFPRSALKPLEAQGRGFTHGHKKIISVPRTTAARLKHIFTKAAATEHEEEELRRWCQQAREAVLQAACTLQYDSAVHSGTQLGVALRPEPFSSRQQQRSKFDGQVEEADDSAPRRHLIPVTDRELNGHLKREEESSIAESRPMRHPYKELPLTGAIQSMMPMYRRSDSFGHIEIPDEFGYYPGAATERPENGGWLPYAKEYAVGPDGEVTGFHMPNGELASAEQIKDDCEAWKTSFARDQRASFIQNHDHDCTGTCIKYQQKKSATELPQRAGQKIAGPGVPKCRFRFFRHVALRVLGIIKYVIRRGKELVEKAFIATGNEENEFGKAMVPRQSPFRSSSMDVLQSTIRCNADYQYQRRAVPDLQVTEQEPSAKESHNFTASFLCGCGVFKRSMGKLIMTTLATAMRAANVADFYMTKYLSKAQEALGPVMQPFIAGMRRSATAESAPEAAETTLIERARQRIRRFIFCANRTMWFSACELGVFLTTGDSCVKTEKTTKVFSGKGVAMMHECKRLLNHSTAAEGLLLARNSTERREASSMDAFLVAQPGDTRTDEDSDATEHAGSDATLDEDRDAAERARGDPDADDPLDEDSGATERAHGDPSGATTEPPTKKQRKRSAVASDEQTGDATERADYMEDDCDEALPAVITSPDAATAITDATGKKQMFAKSLAHRDDWLHRGIMLRDMDYYHYARYVAREEMPRSGSAQSYQKRHGVYYLFDAHYSLAKSYVQILRKQAKTVQNVGPQCKRSDVNGGEDNAVYKAYFHSCVHCPGPQRCADPLMYQQLLYPRIDDIDQYLATLQSTPCTKRVQTRFAPAWKARRYELEVLADRAAEKHNRAMRIGVIHDTTSFKGVRIPRKTNAPDAATEHAFELKLQQVLIQQTVLRAMSRGTCLERVMQKLMEYLACPMPWHPDQPHLAEWQAFSTREILFNLDQSVEARNMAQKQAAKHKSLLTKDGEEDDGEENASKPKIIIEDLGGVPPDLDDETYAEDAPRAKHELQMPTSIIARLLARTAERDTAGHVGRPKDMHKEMQRVAAIFGTELDDIIQPFHVEHHDNRAMGTAIHEALQHQKTTAQTLRQQQDTEVATEQNEAHAEVHLLTQEAAELLQSLPTDLAASGPVAFAKHLVEAATLNQDQRAPVALIAKDMQIAWEKQGKPQHMKPHGKILRMLLLGGGGCGKSRIVNLVLTALFLQFWGPRGCVKAAPSNKAARGILGRTLHVVAKLGGGSLTMLNLRCNAAAQSALAYLWVSCGAFIIDEAAQGAAALYHAVALRSCYGRASAHGVEASDYAEPSQTFGAMPIVVECGDELQLPPVPASASLFAEQSRAATEHLAGVEIFKQKDYVYRLSTMKRFTDATLISILTKMRRSGGCKLTTQEWKALRDTDISAASATEQRERLRGTELWYQAAPTWATVSMAQGIRSRLSAVQAAATLFIVPAQDYVLNRPQNSRLTDAYLAEQIASVPNMNNTGRLPSIGMVHLGMIIRLTNTVEAPEAVTDSTGEVVGIDPHPDEPGAATEHASPIEGIRILRRLPTVTVKLHNVSTKLLPAMPCTLHAVDGACRDCESCDFRAGCVAVEPQLSRRSFPVEVQDPGSDAWYTLQVQRRQLPMTIKTASTLNTLQGVTADPGLIFHWKFPRFFSEELRWLATYVAISRPPSLAQLISVGLPDELRNIIEGGPPEGILSRFNDMFKEKEDATHMRAAEVMRELGWDATD